MRGGAFLKDTKERVGVSKRAIPLPKKRQSNSKVHTLQSPHNKMSGIRKAIAIQPVVSAIYPMITGATAPPTIVMISNEEASSVFDRIPQCQREASWKHDALIQGEERNES